MEEKYIIGDLNKDNLKDVWNNQMMINLRKMMIERKYKEIELCKNCTNLWHTHNPASFDVAAIFKNTLHRLNLK